MLPASRYAKQEAGEIKKIKGRKPTLNRKLLTVIAGIQGFDDRLIVWEAG